MRRSELSAGREARCQPPADSPVTAGQLHLNCAALTDHPLLPVNPKCAWRASPQIRNTRRPRRCLASGRINLRPAPATKCAFVPEQLGLTPVVLSLPRARRRTASRPGNTRAIASKMRRRDQTAPICLSFRRAHGAARQPSTAETRSDRTPPLCHVIPKPPSGRRTPLGIVGGEESRLVASWSCARSSLVSEQAPLRCLASFWPCGG
jgi:hypothetical protein